jgi:hypothetical protein
VRRDSTNCSFASFQADILSKMIYNNSNQAGVAGVGGRIKVAGTTITNANIKAE